MGQCSHRPKRSQGRASGLLPQLTPCKGHTVACMAPHGSVRTLRRPFCQSRMVHSGYPMQCVPVAHETTYYRQRHELSMTTRVEFEDFDSGQSFPGRWQEKQSPWCQHAQKRHGQQSPCHYATPRGVGRCLVPRPAAGGAPAASPPPRILLRSLWSCPLRATAPSHLFAVCRHHVGRLLSSNRL